MADRPFDPTEAVTFDLAFGHIHLDGAPHRVMIPAPALVKLCRAAGDDETADLAYAIGEAMGRRVAVRLAARAGAQTDGDKRRHEAVRAAGIDQVVGELAGEMAIAGMGALGAERWGKALALVVAQSPFGEDGDDLLAGILQAALRAMTGASARIVRLVRDPDRVRFLVVGGATVEAVRARLGKGESWGAVLAALQPGGAS